MIDVISILEEYDIEYRTSGKNVTRGWVEINCPFCSDPSFHLGINLTSGLFHCWVCGTKGNFEKLARKLLELPFYEVKKVIEEFNVSFQETEKEEQDKKIDEVVFPKGIEKKFPDLHWNYLKQRGFNPDKLIKKYKLKACWRLGGKFAYRIIIPVIMNGVTVSLIGRDVTGEQTPKYHNLPNEQSIVNLKNCLYGIDSIKQKGKAIIVEGVFDKWRIGDDCCALLGTEYTKQQLYLLYEKELKEAYVLLDADATKKAHKLAHILSTFVDKVEVLELGEGDPADLKQNQVLKLRSELNI